MAVSLQTLIDRSVKNMGAGINAIVKASILEVIKRAYSEGIYVQVSSGYRSNADQQRLYNQGRTTPGNIVTNAKPGQSLHNYGLAIDYFLVSDDGKTALWSVNAKWRRVAAIGKSLGFEWGGDWKGFVDYPHLQMTGGLSLAQLQAGKRPKLVSKVSGGVAQTAKPVAKPSVKPAPKPVSKPLGKTVHLPKSAKTWRTYKTTVQPVAKNSDWSLTPSKFGGLTYSVIAQPYPDVVTIKTSRGNRNIYVGKGTGATIK